MKTLLSTALATTLIIAASVASADPLMCDLSGYKTVPGLTAVAADNALTVTWDGDRNQEVRLRLTIESGTPTIRDLAVRRKGGQWATLASHATPEFRIVSGVRRMSNQHLQPLRGLNVRSRPTSSIGISGMPLGRALSIGPPPAAGIRLPPKASRTNPVCRESRRRSRARRPATRRMAAR
jgi:hypothetical protein